jgi:membrane protease YdiL (CAAX protease family)
VSSGGATVMSTSHIIRNLTDSVRQVARGNYGAANRIFQVASSGSRSEEVGELAEMMGLMCVKVEAREFSLEQKIEEIEKRNAELKRVNTLRAESSFLLCTTILVLGAYMILLSVGLSAGWLTKDMATPVSLGLMLVLLGVIVLYSHHHRYPWATWGITWKGSRRALTESLLWCIPWSVAAVALKAWLIHQPSSRFYGEPLWDFRIPPLVVGMYLLMSIVQEIICRGYAQNSIERVLTGKYRGLMAVVTTSVLFAVVHLHYSLSTMVATLLAGLFFGWLYRRHGTLTGVSLAHFLLGTLVIDVLQLIG